jgi:arylformamidase
MGAAMIYDISPPITPQLAVFPGDTPPSREVLLDMSRGDPLTLSTWTSTVHVGAHADAPSHYGVDGATIEQQPLELYCGPCRVIHVDGKFVTPQMIPDVDTERLLIATGSYPDPTHWNDDFAALTPELVDHLGASGVRLIGVDTPSVDPADSKDLPAHHRFLANNMAIIEGLVLADVPAGEYELIALPLRLTGFDASPVRAVLRT